MSSGQAPHRRQAGIPIHLQSDSPFSCSRTKTFPIYAHLYAISQRPTDRKLFTAFGVVLRALGPNRSNPTPTRTHQAPALYLIRYLGPRDAIVVRQT